MYRANDKRYDTMTYNRCGHSGLKLPAVSLGLWHNFGDTAVYENMKKLCFTAFDNGITHFDLANNYGPEPGSAEKNFGRIVKENLSSYRDEMITRPVLQEVRLTLSFLWLSMVLMQNLFPKFRTTRSDNLQSTLFVVMVLILLLFFGAVHGLVLILLKKELRSGHPK